MVIFNSYVSLPEGNIHTTTLVSENMAFPIYDFDFRRSSTAGSTETQL